MSLNVICSECGENCGWFTGRNISIGILSPEDGNKTDNIFAVGKVEGHAEATFQNLKTIQEVFICRKCLQTKMPKAYKAIHEHPKTGEKNSVRVRIKEGWEDAGQKGTVLGTNLFVEQLWTPVKWDDEEDPNFHKTIGLEFI